MSAPNIDLELIRPAQLRKPHWNPKRWHPVYEEVVLMDLMGYKNIEIARLKGFTVQHISNILQTEQASRLRELAIARQRALGTQTFEMRLERATERAMNRIESVLENDEYAEKNPGGIFDRSLKLLQSTKKVGKTDGTDVVNNVMVVPASSIAQMKEALAESDAVRARHQLMPGEGVNTLR